MCVQLVNTWLECTTTYIKVVIYIHSLLILYFKRIRSRPVLKYGLKLCCKSVLCHFSKCIHRFECMHLRLCLSQYCKGELTCLSLCCPPPCAAALLHNLEVRSSPLCLLMSRSHTHMWQACLTPQSVFVKHALMASQSQHNCKVTNPGHIAQYFKWDLT